MQVKLPVHGDISVLDTGNNGSPEFQSKILSSVFYRISAQTLPDLGSMFGH